MIPVSLSMLLMIYVLGFLGLVFLFWSLHNLRKRRHESAALRHRLRCTLCSFEFENRTSTLLPRCPRCGGLNERFPLRSL
jgi:hypothetical protein